MEVHVRKFGIFILGIIVGVISTFITLFFVGTSLQGANPLDGLILFEKPGECMTKEPVKVFQVLASDAALANERSNREYNWYTGKVVLVINDKGQTYYDEQVIKAKTCFRQIGTFKYQTKDQDWKTVPVIEGE